MIRTGNGCPTRGLGRHSIPAPRHLVGRFERTQGAEIRKSRPAVVITADALNRARRTVVVVPLSTGPEPHPPVVVATPSAGARSVAVCDQLRAVDKRRLARNAGRISGSDLGAIEDGIRRIFEL